MKEGFKSLKGDITKYKIDDFINAFADFQIPVERLNSDKQRTNSLIHELDKRNHFNNNDEFNKFMGLIDLRLQEKNVPIELREILGMAEVAAELKTEIYGNSESCTKPNDYSNYSLSGYVRLWFQKRYGNRLKIDLVCAKTIVYIQNDYYEVNIPLIIGNPVFIFDNSLINYNSLKDRRINIARFIKGLTVDMANVLDEKNIKAIIDQISKGIQLGLLIRRFSNLDYIKEAKGDLIQAVNLLFQSSPLCGLSKWESLQFTEKIIKAYLTKNNISIPKSHKIRGLIALIHENNLGKINVPNIDKIQCCADVRYNSQLVSKDEAVIAHWTSIDLAISILAML